MCQIVRELPVLAQNAISLIFLVQKTFGEIIGMHGVSRFIGNNQKAIGVTIIVRATPDMFPEPVPLDKEVLGPVGNPVSDGQLKGSSIVLKHATTKGSKARGRDVEHLSNLKKQMANRKKSLETHAQGCILGFSGRQGNLRV